MVFDILFKIDFELFVSLVVELSYINITRGVGLRFNCA